MSSAVKALVGQVTTGSLRLNFLEMIRRELPEEEGRARLFVAKQGYRNVSKAASSPEGREFLCKEGSARLRELLLKMRLFALGPDRPAA